jgi:hypothetical protein
MLACFILAGPMHAPAAPVMLALGVAGIGWEWWAGAHA